MKRLIYSALPCIIGVTMTLAGCGGGKSIFGGNHRPEIVEVTVNGKRVVGEGVEASAKSVRVEPGSTVVLTCFAKDSDRDKLTYKWTNADEQTTPDDPRNRAQFTASGDAGSREVVITVLDDRDGVTTEVITVSWSRNRPPAITGFTATPSVVPRGESSALTAQASDPDGDPLTYQYLADVGRVEQPPAGSVAGRYFPPAAGNQAKVRAVVTDGKASVVSDEVTITITE